MQIMQLLVTKFSPPSRHSIPLRPKYSPQHSVLTLSLCTSLNVHRRGLTPMQNHRQYYSPVCSNIYVSRQKTIRQKVLDRMVATIPTIQSAINSLLNQIWFVTVVPKYLSSDIFKRSVCYVHIPILACILVTRHKHILSFLYVYF
jgi:hypothetical protein